MAQLPRGNRHSDLDRTRVDRAADPLLPGDVRELYVDAPPGLVVSEASRTSPGCRMNVSPSRVVNSSVPESVITYWACGAVCQSSAEPAAVSSKCTAVASSTTSSGSVLYSTCDWPSAPVNRWMQRVMLGAISSPVGRARRSPAAALALH